MPSLTIRNYAVQIPHIWIIRRGQHNQSAMVESLLGWTTILIMVSPLLGKIKIRTWFGCSPITFLMCTTIKTAVKHYMKLHVRQKSWIKVLNQCKSWKEEIKRASDRKQNERECSFLPSKQFEAYFKGLMGDGQRWTACVGYLLIRERQSENLHRPAVN